MKYLTSIIAVLLAIGCFSLPIGYYTFLRLVACGGAVAIIVADRERGVSFSNVLWAIVAVLFNPIFPVYLHSKPDGGLLMQPLHYCSHIRHTIITRVEYKRI